MPVIKNHSKDYRPKFFDSMHSASKKIKSTDQHSNEGFNFGALQ
jgi:hypothetical protein